MTDTTLGKAPTRGAVAWLAVTLAACGGGDDMEAALEGAAASVAPAAASAPSATTLARLPVPSLVLPTKPTVTPAPVAEASVPVDSPTTATHPPATQPTSPDSGVDTSPNLPRSAGDWTAMDKSFNVPHQARPLNVPVDFDWARQGVLQSGNRVPAGWQAYTGWGQVFNAADATGIAQQAVEIRQHQTYLCTSAGGEVRWTLAQQGDIEGAAFRADYKGNEAVAAQISRAADGTTRVAFEPGRAYHFWPASGRAALPGANLCGMLVLVQARAVSLDGQALPDGTRPALVMGLGADYWTTRSAPWDNFRTNAGIGVGWMRTITPQWQWFSMSTASTADLNRLRTAGAVN